MAHQDQFPRTLEAVGRYLSHTEDVLITTDGGYGDDETIELWRQMRYSLGVVGIGTEQKYTERLRLLAEVER